MSDFLKDIKIGQLNNDIFNARTNANNAELASLASQQAARRADQEAEEARQAADKAKRAANDNAMQASRASRIAQQATAQAAESAALAEKFKQEAADLKRKLSAANQKWVAQRIEGLALEIAFSLMGSDDKSRLINLMDQARVRVLDECKPVLEKYGLDYEGEIKGGTRHGQGSYTDQWGCIYSGNWINDILNDGNAKIIYSDGTYQGNVIDGKRNGLGKFMANDGNVAIASYVNNNRNGVTKVTFSNGDVYVGTYIEGKRNGQGRISWANGEEYVGTFADDNRTGLGKFTWANGDEYVGSFIDGKLTGQGKLAWAKGDVYIGAFDDGNRTGQGKFTWADGEVHVGEFLKGVRHGQGKRFAANGKLTGEGVWKDGKFDHGNAYAWKYGGGVIAAKYEGGEPVGDGTWTLDDGRVFVGTWGCEDKSQPGIRNAQGMMQFPDGSKKKAVVNEQLEISYPKLMGIF